MHIDRVEFICYFSFTEKTNAMLFLTQRIFFCHGDDTAITHAHTIVFIVYTLCTSTSKMFIAGTECSNVANTGERSSHAVYFTHLLAQNIYLYDAKRLCVCSPHTSTFQLPHIIRILSFHAHARSAKTWRLGASTQAFFRFFLLKNAYFCTFLLLFTK